MNRGASRVRFIGHGIGLEMDEWPVLARPFTEPLEEGMVIALEPKARHHPGRHLDIPGGIALHEHEAGLLYRQI